MSFTVHRRDVRNAEPAFTIYTDTLGRHGRARRGSDPLPVADTQTQVPAETPPVSANVASSANANAASSDHGSSSANANAASSNHGSSSANANAASSEHGSSSANANAASSEHGSSFGNANSASSEHGPSFEHGNSANALAAAPGLQGNVNALNPRLALLRSYGSTFRMVDANIGFGATPFRSAMAAYRNADAPKSDSTSALSMWSDDQQPSSAASAIHSALAQVGPHGFPSAARVSALRSFLEGQVTKGLIDSFA